LQTNDNLAGEALRTLGVAARELPIDALQEEQATDAVERDLVFLPAFAP
jgi:Ca2+-transporting ATPase